MNVNERINKIKEYFITFNVHDGIAYVLTKFPKKWSLFNKEDIEKEYNIKIEKRDEGVYFLCEISDGFDGMFDAIDYIVSNNLSLEEKTSLLELKIKELSEIFMSEPLERLKTLEFTFPKRSGVKMKKNVVKMNLDSTNTTTNANDSTEVIATTHIDAPSDCHVENRDNATCLVTNKSNKKKKQDVEDSTLLDFAKNMIEGE